MSIEALRHRILEVAFRAGEGHVPSALSILDILWVLHTRTLSSDDCFILSKGHGCLALYAVLEAARGHSPDSLNAFCSKGSALQGHPERWLSYGIEATTGSLGHGLPMAAGLALSKRIKREPGRVFCLVGDGELEEGSCWETLHLAARLNLSNLFLIVDNNRTSPNKLDGTQFVSDLPSKLSAFGWFVLRCDGHDHKMLERLTQPTGRSAQPMVLIADTIKGHGVAEMEADPAAWHHRAPTREMLNEKELV